jgi:hypothetical protein
VPPRVAHKLLDAPALAQHHPQAAREQAAEVRLHSSVEVEVEVAVSVEVS